MCVFPFHIIHATLYILYMRGFHTSQECSRLAWSNELCFGFHSCIMCSLPTNRREGQVQETTRRSMCTPIVQSHDSEKFVYWWFHALVNSCIGSVLITFDKALCLLVLTLNPKGGLVLIMITLPRAPPNFELALVNSCIGCVQITLVKTLGPQLITMNSKNMCTLMR